MATPSSFFWIDIPAYAVPGQVHAFADREQELAQLYKGIVAAGNRVRTSDERVRQKYVVWGPKGVGKSAVILQALGMIRDETNVAEGQRLTLPPELPEPIDRERWLILMASGKRVTNVDAIVDSLQRSILDVLDDVRGAAEDALPDTLALPMVHRLFRTREAKLYAEVRSALLTLTSTVKYVRYFLGAIQTDKLDKKTETTKDIAASIEATFKAMGAEPTGTEAKAGMRLASQYLVKILATNATSVERRRSVDVEWVTDALNELFEATHKARIPTLLVLDDFDEFASSVGPSHLERAKVLESVLSSFSRLSPTCLIIGLRSEYMHEDIDRQYKSLVPVRPMTKAAGIDALDAWIRVQKPSLSAEDRAALLDLGRRLLARFGDLDASVNPFRFLQLIAWLANNRGISDKSARDLIVDYMSNRFTLGVTAHAQQIALGMPEPDLLYSAAGEPVDPSPYAIERTAQLTLSQLGLMRPAVAGDPSDPRIVLDPLIAYLRAAMAPKASAAEVVGGPPPERG